MKEARLTPKQEMAALKNPGLAKAFRGTQIHEAFSNSVKRDKWLMERVDVRIGERNAAGRFISVPDVTLKGGGAWWDVTTVAQEGNHLTKYANWGVGHVLTY